MHAIDVTLPTDDVEEMITKLQHLLQPKRSSTNPNLNPEDLLIDQSSMGLSSLSINTKGNGYTTGRSVMNALRLKVNYFGAEKKSCVAISLVHWQRAFTSCKQRKKLSRGLTGGHVCSLKNAFSVSETHWNKRRFCVQKNNTCWIPIWKKIALLKIKNFKILSWNIHVLKMFDLTNINFATVCEIEFLAVDARIFSQLVFCK